MASERRLSTLSRHLAGTSLGAAMAPAPCSANVSFDPKEMANFLTRDNQELRAKIAEFLEGPLFQPNHSLSLAETRIRTSRRMEAFVRQGFFSIEDYIRDPLRFTAALEVPTFVDYSLSIKTGVHATLCGGTIASLGNAEQRARFLPKMDRLELAGCFGMTELGHGSNVMGIRTTAVYDAAAGEFVINTPDDDASKFWIGGAAETAHISAIFAQLTVNGVEEGVHVFVVPMRDPRTGAVLPGVRVADNGPKMGLNGVDNGQIWLDNVRVPRENMLDRYGSVSASGVYSSPLPTPAARFGMTVGGLTTGRVLIAQGALDATKTSLLIALRYAYARPQFGDALVGDYITHRRRLLPALATTYGMQLAMQKLKAVFKLRDPARAKEVHLLSSGLKAAATWARQTVVQDCRECCGGMGFKAANRFGEFLTDMNVDVTFEGDNTVLMQQVARALVDAALKTRGAPPPAPAPLGSRPAAAAALALLAWREDALAAELARALAAGGPAAWDANLDKTLDLGWAYVERLLATTFAEETAAAPASLRPALALLGELYALSRVEAGAATYALAGLLDAPGAAALRARVNAICADLSANRGAAALLLTQGYGIPESLIRAPIARDWNTEFTYRGRA